MLAHGFGERLHRAETMPFVRAIEEVVEDVVWAAPWVNTVELIHTCLLCISRPIGWVKNDIALHRHRWVCNEPEKPTGTGCSDVVTRAHRSTHKRGARTSFWRSADKVWDLGLHACDFNSTLHDIRSYDKCY